VLNDPAYRQNAQAYGAKLRAGGGYQAAARLILEHVRQRTTRKPLRQVS